jgi:hypothetical protein
MNRESLALTIIYIAAMAVLLMDIFFWRPL